MLFGQLLLDDLDDLLVLLFGRFAQLVAYLCLSETRSAAILDGRIGLGDTGREVLFDLIDGDVDDEVREHIFNASCACTEVEES